MIRIAPLTNLFTVLADPFGAQGATVPAMTLLSTHVMKGNMGSVGSLGCSMPEHSIHSPDEYVRVEAFAACHQAFVDLLFEVARVHQREGRVASPGKREEL